jgi:two-component system sensor histidine kinase HydH
MGAPLFDDLKQYVGFDESSSAALRAYHPLARPHFPPIIDDFYAAIAAHPDAQATITGGQPQIDRLKQTLLVWMDDLFVGPHDEVYFQKRARIGRMHVRIGLPQAYMFTAMNRIRVHLHDVIHETTGAGGAGRHRVLTAMHQILDLELAIMLETYREDLLAKSGKAERLATLGQFAASIGHELRNPLGVIESSLFLLRQHLGSEVSRQANVRKHLDRIGGEITRANNTIRDLLDLARDRPPRRQPTALLPLVQKAGAAALPPAIALQLSVPAELSADVDPDQLQQVLVNLLVNAEQAMKGAGRVLVEGQAAPGGGVRLRVRDEGPGVPEEVRHQIFEALFTTKAKGSGLGLALCRRIVEAHGGTIDLDPPGGRGGASFVLTLPAAGRGTAS